MSALTGLTYTGWALLYALAGTALLLAGCRLAGRRPGAAAAALAVATLFMVFLGLHPFPPPEAVTCKQPILRPFAFLEAYGRLWRAAAPPRVWLQNTGVVAPVVNFAVCFVVGALLARQTRRFGLAALYGLALSGFIELSQLSGLWGVYPCPYRTFEVDDLILNVGGVLAGFALARRRTKA